MLQCLYLYFLFLPKLLLDLSFSLTPTCVGGTIDGPSEIENQTELSMDLSEPQLQYRLAAYAEKQFFFKFSEVLDPSGRRK